MRNCGNSFAFRLNGSEKIRPALATSHKEGTVLEEGMILSNEVLNFLRVPPPPWPWGHSFFSNEKAEMMNGPD